MLFTMTTSTSLEHDTCIYRYLQNIILFYTGAHIYSEMNLIHLRDELSCYFPIFPHINTKIGKAGWLFITDSLLWRRHYWPLVKGDNLANAKFWRCWIQRNPKHVNCLAIYDPQACFEPCELHQGHLARELMIQCYFKEEKEKEKKVIQKSFSEGKKNRGLLNFL